MDKINQQVRKLSLNQEKIIVRLQNLDKCVRKLLSSHLTVNENVSEFSKDIEQIEKQRSENLNVIMELERKIEKVNTEMIEKINTIKGLESDCKTSGQIERHV